MKIFGFLVILLFLTSCATVMNGDMVSVPVYTTPSGAKISVNGREYTSPTTVQVPRGKGDFQLHIKKDGYQDVTLLLRQSADGWLWGNILFSSVGLIGVAVDFLSGDAYDIEPELVSENLIAIKNVKMNAGHIRLALYDINDLPANLVKKIKSKRNN